MAIVGFALHKSYTATLPTILPSSPERRLSRGVCLVLRGYNVEEEGEFLGLVA